MTLLAQIFEGDFNIMGTSNGPCAKLIRAPQFAKNVFRIKRDNFIFSMWDTYGGIPGYPP